MPPPPREQWAALTGPERLVAMHTFGAQGAAVALRWRTYARRVRLAERRCQGREQQRLCFARYLVESGRLNEGRE